MSATHDTHNWDTVSGQDSDLERRSRECRERGEALEALADKPKLHPLVKGLAAYWSGRTADLEADRLRTLLWSIAWDAGIPNPGNLSPADADAWLAKIANA
jgi:hypothetical protein